MAMPLPRSKSKPKGKRKSHPETINNGDGEEVQCAAPYCGKMFRNRRGLTMHYRNNPFCSPGNSLLLTNRERQIQNPNAHPNSQVNVVNTVNITPNLDVEDPNMDGFDPPDLGEGADSISAAPAMYCHPVARTPKLLTHIPHTMHQAAEIKLLKLLNDVRAPFDLYKRIMDWGQECANGGYNFVAKNKTRAGAIGYLNTWLNLQHLQPITKPISLPGDGLQLHITILDFAASLSSILTNPELVGDMSLLDVNPNDPFGRYSPPNTRLNCVNSGQWYQDAYDYSITDPSRQLFVPIVFACDETKLAGSGKAGCWPLVFSTTLLSQKLRNRPNAWRPLGYIYDLSILESQAIASINVELRYERLQAIFRVVLESFVAAQSGRGLHDCDVVLGGISKNVDIVAEAAYCIGDIAGGDKLAGRKAAYQDTAKRLCRKCDIPGSSAGDYNVECNKIVQADVVALIDAQDTEALRRISQYPIKSAFFDVTFGGCPYGIFSAACPVEALHALENGLIKDCNIVFRDSLSKPAQARLDLLLRDFSKLEKQKYFTAGTCSDMPRLIWKEGITTLSELTAAQHVGIMFVTVVFSMTTTGELFLNEQLGSNEVVKMRLAFQMLLCYWQWLKQEEFWCRGDVAAKEGATQAIRILLRDLANLFPRHQGNGWNKPKYHEQLHIPDDIERYGAHRNYHTGPTEHHHIQNVKKPAKQTQRRRSVLDWQLAQRLHEGYVIDTAHSLISVPADCHDRTYPDGFTPHSSKGIFSITTVDADVSVSFRWTSAANHVPVHPLLMQAVALYSIESSTTGPFGFFTEYRRSNELFRGHPDYRGIGPSYDWVNVRWEREETSTRRNRNPRYDVEVSYNDDVDNRCLYDYAPAKIIGFLKDRDIMLVVIIPCAITFQRGTVFSTKWELETVHPNRHVIPQVVTVDSIVGHTLMIPEDITGGLTYHEIWHPERWSGEFFSWDDV